MMVGEWQAPMWAFRSGRLPYDLDSAVEEWVECEPKEIDLGALFDVLLPRFREAGDLVAVFTTALQKGVFLELSVFEEDLRREPARVG